MLLFGLANCASLTGDASMLLFGLANMIASCLDWLTQSVGQFITAYLGPRTDTFQILHFFNLVKTNLLDIVFSQGPKFGSLTNADN